LAIAIPASVISDTPHLREKTSKVGYIGRAAAIFRVDEIIVYADDPKVNQNRDIDFISGLLSYMETPQYLRKRLFELKPELQFAGILPPLRTPHHPLLGKIRDLKAGEYREGVAVSRVREGMLVDIGSEQPALLRSREFPVNTRLTVKVKKLAQRAEVEIVERDQIPEYWGYMISVEKRTLHQFLEDRKFDLTIGTSKLATQFRDVSQSLGERWMTSNNILVLFGAPSRGLFEIAKDEGVELNNLVDFVLNTVPNQGTETVRTEEALLASLAILNIHFDP
jgi:predicted SPOUT superfamily RNA methylase MTH1